MATRPISFCSQSILYKMVIIYRSSSQSCSQSLGECFPILLHHPSPCMRGVIMCIHICKYECVCTNEGACRDLRLTWGIFSVAPHFIYWGRSSHLNPELTIWFLGLTSLIIPLMCFQVLWLQDSHTCLSFKGMLGSEFWLSRSCRECFPYSTISQSCIILIIIILMTI